MSEQIVYIGFENGACRTSAVEKFYVEQRQSNKAAKETCAQCAYTEPCLEYALANNEQFGVWGGLSFHERKALVRERKAAAAVGEISLSLDSNL